MGSHPIPLFKHDTEAEKFSCPFVSLPGTSGLTTWAISWHTEYVPLPLFTHAQFGEKRMRSFSLSLPERFLSKKRESFQSLLDLLKYDWEQLPLGWTKTDWRIWSTNIWTIWSIICLKNTFAWFRLFPAHNSINMPTERKASFYREQDRGWEVGAWMEGNGRV